MESFMVRSRVARCEFPSHQWVGHSFGECSVCVCEIYILFQNSNQVFIAIMRLLNN